MLQKLGDLIEQLHLRGIADSLKSVLTEARHQGQSIEEVLQKLLEAEYQDRNARRLANRLKADKLPWEWSIDTFPFKRQPTVKKSQIMSLAKLDFITHFENVIFIGKPGTGKTGLAISLLRLALINGYRGRFYKAQDLLNELYASLADRSTSKLLKTIANYDVIVIDELGYLMLTNEQINIFLN